MRYFIVNERGEEIPGAYGASSQEAWADFPVVSLAVASGYSCRYEEEDDEDEFDVNPAPVPNHARNPSGHPMHGFTGIKSDILSILEEGPEIPANIALEVGKTEHIVRAHLWQLKARGIAKPSDRKIPVENPRGPQHQYLWELVS